MIQKKDKKMYWFGITFLISLLLLAILFFTFFNHNKTLTGSHLFQNIVGDGQYTLSVTLPTTGYYVFAIYDFNKDINYEVYDTRNNELIRQGRVGYTIEGYRPFIAMSLESNVTYAVNLTLVDKNTFGFAHIELCE